MCHMYCGILLMLMWIILNRTWSETLLLVLDVGAQWLCFWGVAKDFDLSSIFTVVSNVFVVVGLDKDSVSIILFRVALFLSVVKYKVLYTEYCGTTIVVLGYG